jgi:hypothetical protein
MRMTATSGIRSGARRPTISGRSDASRPGPGTACEPRIAWIVEHRAAARPPRPAGRWRPSTFSSYGRPRPRPTACPTAASRSSGSTRRPASWPGRPGTPRPGPFFADLAGVVDVPWDIAVGGDRVYPGVEGRRTLRSRLINAYLGRLHAAAAHDATLGAAFLRVTGLVSPPPVAPAPRGWPSGSYGPAGCPGPAAPPRATGTPSRRLPPGPTMPPEPSRLTPARGPGTAGAGPRSGSGPGRGPWPAPRGVVW